MEIKEKNIIAAYKAANEEIKALFKTMFPEINFTQKDTRPVTERIRTFDDACAELGDDNPLVQEYQVIISTIDCPKHDLEAYLQLRIITAALNEGWEPQFTEGEYRWYPWYYLYKTKEEYEAESESWKEKHPLVLFGGAARYGAYCGFVYARSISAPSNADARIGSRLCLKSEALADYCGKQFATLWADFYLIRK